MRMVLKISSRVNLDSFIRFFALLFIIACLSGCAASIDPGKVDIELKNQAPKPKITSFDTPLADLGKMTEIYGKGVLVQSEIITDNTGSSRATDGEIPQDITEMTKSALNAIGGNIVYIPYNPSFINNQMLTGYSDFQNKLIPDVILSGGITEFDRALETKDRSKDFDVTSRSFNVNQSWVPDDTIRIGYNDAEIEGSARITVDYNLLDFQTMAGVAKVQTVNTIIVHKAMAEKNLAFSLFGPTFGLQGTVKKIQGRHAAIRLLVQLSVIQILGKYLLIPYWDVLPGAEPDPVILDFVSRGYRQMSDTDKIINVQAFLFLKGYNVDLEGDLNQKTKEALKKFDPSFDTTFSQVSVDLYLKLWESIGENLDAALDRRRLFDQKIAEKPQEEEGKQEKPPETGEEKSALPCSQTRKTTKNTTENKAVDIEKQQELRQKVTEDAMFRLLRKMRVWEDRPNSPAGTNP